jgi:hypothetical protein
MPNFDPNTLPLPVRVEFNKDALWWNVMVQAAIKEKITDLDKLASWVFYMHHPRAARKADRSR